MQRGCYETGSVGSTCHCFGGALRGSTKTEETSNIRPMIPARTGARGERKHRSPAVDDRHSAGAWWSSFSNGPDRRKIWRKSHERLSGSAVTGLRDARRHGRAVFPKAAQRATTFAEFCSQPSAVECLRYGNKYSQ